VCGPYCHGRSSLPTTVVDPATLFGLLGYDAAVVIGLNWLELSSLSLNFRESESELCVNKNSHASVASGFFAIGKNSFFSLMKYGGGLSSWSRFFFVIGIVMELQRVTTWNVVP